jgi:hypothetical protein
MAGQTQQQQSSQDRLYTWQSTFDHHVIIMLYTWQSTFDEESVVHTYRYSGSSCSWVLC